MKLGNLFALGFFLMALFVAGVPVGRAQDNYEIQVYGYETVDPRPSLMAFCLPITLSTRPLKSHTG